MYRSANIVIAFALLSGASCSVVNKLKGGGTSGATSGGDAVTESDDDSHEVKAAIRELAEAEAKLAAGDYDAYARKSSSLNYSFYVKKEVDDSGKGGKLKARLASFDVKAVNAIGGLLAKHYGDGKRVTQAKSNDALEAMAKAIDICESATTTHGSYSQGETQATRLADYLTKYDEAMQRALRVDPNIIRYVGDWSGGSYMDVPSELMKCEAQIAAHRLNVEDAYAEETVPEGANEKKGCGKITFLVDGVQVGNNKFAPFTRTGGGQSWPEEVPCNKIPKKDTVGKEHAGAIKEFKEHNQELEKAVFAVKAKPYVEESKEDLRLHKWQELEAYSTVMTLRANPCGGEKLFCEAGGSKGGKMLNELEHHMDRADVHAGTRPDRCKEHLKAGFKKWEEFRDFRDDSKKSGKWIDGATYVTKKGEKLPEPDFVAKFEKSGKLADERALGDYCTKKAATKPATPAKKDGQKDSKK